jgi:hypothetical protein
MNIKRSYLKLLMSSVTVGLLLANCTVKESQSDECEKGDKDTGCVCADGSVGYQVCNSSGVFGSCQCPDANTAGTTGNNTAGTSSNGGTSSTDGGAPSATAGKTSTAGTDAGGAPGMGGAGGEGGAPLTFDPENCEECLSALCSAELSACLADTTCFSANGDGTGQYERIISCIDGERINGLVKRDVVRGCGVTIGASPDASLADAWAPEGMVPATTNLLNCMATSSSATPNADWANSDDNYPVVNEMVVPAPWPEDSCAKLSCTSKFQ